MGTPAVSLDRVGELGVGARPSDGPTEVGAPSSVAKVQP